MENKELETQKEDKNEIRVRKYYSNIEKREEYDAIMDILPVIDKEHFYELLFVSIAEIKNLSSDEENDNVIVGDLSFDYKNAINDILYQDGASKKYKSIIDLGEFYYMNNVWQKNMCDAKENFLKNNKSKYKYNFHERSLILEFTKEGIKQIKNNYDDETITVMTLFANDIINYFKEEEKEKKYTR